MSELISGKDALIALANGEDVEFKCGGMSWSNLDAKQQPLEILIDKSVVFRLKPRTITINGFEVPACGENYKEGEDVYVLNDCCDERGYVEYSVSGYNFEGLLPKLWWRTEEDIKQVVAAIRKVFTA